MDLQLRCRLASMLIAIRYDKKQTQTKVAKKLGVTFQQVQKYERGINAISLDKLLTFCEATNTDLSWFLRPLDKLGKKLYINGRAKWTKQ